MIAHLRLLWRFSAALRRGRTVLACTLDRDGRPDFFYARGWLEDRELLLQAVVPALRGAS